MIKLKGNKWLTQAKLELKIKTSFKIWHFIPRGYFFYFDGTKAGEIKNGPKIKID